MYSATAKMLKGIANNRKKQAELSSVKNEY
jgi:hypothetical protein